MEGHGSNKPSCRSLLIPWEHRPETVMHREMSGVDAALSLGSPVWCLGVWWLPSPALTHVILLRHGAQYGWYAHSLLLAMDADAILWNDL